MLNTKFIIETFVSIFIIVDPIGLIPTFVSLTTSYSPKKITRTVQEATLTLVFVLGVFTFWGNKILHFFGITIPAFRIAGGVVIFMVAWQMLQAQRTRLKTTPEEEAYTLEQEEIGVVPLGVPMLAGPGAITTVLVLVGDGGYLKKLIIFSVIFIIAFITYFILRWARQLAKWLGPTGLNIFTRLMGLILAAIAVQFILDGIKTAFP
ncbi:MAG: MarC family protein [Candidatus Desulfofervidaceae bacterium]|nr:MarC family protein [Candidatus Desulfofervidaceae bacterium]